MGGDDRGGILQDRWKGRNLTPIWGWGGQDLKCLKEKINSDSGCLLSTPHHQQWSNQKIRRRTFCDKIFHRPMTVWSSQHAGKLPPLDFTKEGRVLFVLHVSSLPPFQTHYFRFRAFSLSDTLCCGPTPSAIQRAPRQQWNGAQVIPSKTCSAACAAGLQGKKQSSTKTSWVTSLESIQSRERR